MSTFTGDGTDSAERDYHAGRLDRPTKRRCPTCGKSVPVDRDGQLHPHKLAGRASRFCGRTGR